jgi:hypothetical protein
MINEYIDASFLCEKFTYQVDGISATCPLFFFTSSEISGKTHIYSNFPYPNLSC